MRATLFFSDGSKIDVEENELLFGIGARPNTEQPANLDDKEFDKYQFEFPLATDVNGPFEVWGHTSNGLIPSLTEILANYLFFYKIDKPGIVYTSQTVVRIETK